MAQQLHVRLQRRWCAQPPGACHREHERERRQRDRADALPARRRRASSAVRRAVEARGQRLLHRGRIRVAPSGIGCARPRDHLVQRRGYVDACEVGTGPRGVGYAPAQHVLQHAAERVQVVRRRAQRALQDLGREPRECRGAAQARVDFGRFAAGTEIGEHDASATLAQHVVGLDVAMQQPGRVHRRERAAQRESEYDRFVRAERPLRGDLLREALAVDPFAPEPGPSILHGRAVHAQHVVVAHLRESACLVEERSHAHWLRGVRSQQLQRDIGAEARVPCAVHLAAAAARDLRLHDEVSPAEQRGRMRAPKRRVEATECARDVGQCLQRLELAFGAVRRRVERTPVRRFCVEDAFDQAIDRARIIACHRPSSSPVQPPRA